MKRSKISIMLALILTAGGTALAEEKSMIGFYTIQVEMITGAPIRLEAYQGKTLLIVNTASRCGFTGQYDGLQKLYETYQNKGLVVLGFPSNNFLHQEPGTNEEIESFCRQKYGVTFPMFSKISVKGKDAHPLYRYLTSEDANPGFGGKISWNFNKFLISKDGKTVARFGSRTKPDDPELIKAIEAEVGAK